MNALALLLAYALLSLANLVGNAIDSPTLTDATKPLLMPVLLAWLVVERRSDWSRPLTWLAAGVGFAWMGDLLLMGDGDAWFLGGIAAFLLMQVAYLMAFTRVPGPGLVRAWRIAVLPYVIVWAGLNAVIWPGVEELRIPVLVYSLVLVAMAVAGLDLSLRLAPGYRWWVAIGSALFVVSDGLIAVTHFGPLTDTPLTSAVVMLTYVTAQGLIVVGMGLGQRRITR